jgi:hypothetical protein
VVRVLPLDVNDAALRERFLREDFLPALAPLRPETAGMEEWPRTHTKHCHHHLLPFGLVA